MECSIGKHDDQQLEIKVAYSLDRRRAQERYHLDMFVFLPYQFGVTAATYSRQQFYADLLSYTRFKTPVISLRELLNAELPTSPLTRVVSSIAAGVNLGGWDQSRLTYELKMLAIVIRVQVRDGARYLRSLAVGRDAAGPWSDLAIATERMLDDLSAVLEKFRGLRAELLSSSVPDPVAQTYNMADEYISAQVESLLLRLLRLSEFDGRGPAELEEVRRRIRKTARAETEYRVARGYPVVAPSDNESGNEYFLYRESLLKKFCANVLFLSVERHEGPRRARGFFSASVSGIAYTIFVVVVWLASKFFRSDDVLALGLASIPVYIFRERFKEIAREIGDRILPKLFSDRTNKLVDRRENKHVGTTREVVRWLERRQLPRDVLEARRYEDTLEQAVSEPTELVLHYDRNVRIDSAAIFESHQRAVAIDEILRLQVANWTARMDNPRQTLLVLGKDDGPVREVRAGRVYHVNLVLRLTACETNEAILRKARLILSKQCLERIEN